MKQYLRKVSLIAQNPEKEFDLSNFHFTFAVQRADISTPANLNIRLYNPNPDTLNQLKQALTITLSVGYKETELGEIFNGEIVPPIRNGKESPVDTYLHILAIDGDSIYNFGMLNTSVEAGTSLKDRLEKITREIGALGLDYQVDNNPEYYRGRVFFGPARRHLDSLTASIDATWRVENGRLLVLPRFRVNNPNQVTELNSRTGLIGLPEQTQDGIRARCLINPDIRVGSAVLINNKDVQQVAFSPEYRAINFFPSIANDGRYKVIWYTIQGDTRGNVWYQDLLCVAINEAEPISVVNRGYTE